MKKLMSLTALMFFAISISFAQNDAITKYFDKYVDDERFDVVYVSPKMFEMVAKIEIDEMDSDVQEVIRELKGLRILHTEENVKEFYKEARSKISLDEYELMVQARDGNENVRIMVKDEGDVVKELFMLIGGEKNFAMISFVGNIDLKKVGKLAKALDVDGLHHLKKLDDSKN
jgi:hypothetical protein